MLCIENTWVFDVFLEVRGIKTQTHNLNLPLAVSSYSSVHFMTIGKTSSQTNGFLFPYAFIYLYRPYAASTVSYVELECCLVIYMQVLSIETPKI